MKFKLFILALIPLLVASCSREPLPIPVEEEGKIITIKVDIAPETRVAYSGGTGDNALSWQVGDKILLVGSDGTNFIGGKVFTWDGGNNFTGEAIPGATKFNVYFPGLSFIPVMSGPYAGSAQLIDNFPWGKQTQEGNGSTAHISSRLIMCDENWKTSTQFQLAAKSSIIKFEFTTTCRMILEGK